MQKFYLGTYTKRKSKGIYSIELDTKRKILQNLKLEYEINSPTYINIDNYNNIYSTSNLDDYGGISICKENKIISSKHFEIATPCYISSNYQGYILTSNYHSSTVCLYKQNNDEIILLDKIEHFGKSIKREQEKSHIHFSDFTPDKKFVIVCDLGDDKLLTYKIESEKLIKVAEYNCKKGAGARHITFHPQKNIAYLICELEATIEVLKYDDNYETFEKIQEIKIIEDDTQKKWASAIHVSKDGKNIYVSNRGYDVIVCFKINEKGLLTKIQTAETFGSVPRDFYFDISNKFIIVAHQETDNLTLFERNLETGLITVIQKDIFAPEVICIKRASDNF